MNEGKILKVRPGHNANCSAIDYMGGFVVGFVGYLLLLGILVVAQLSLRAKSLRNKVGTGTRVTLWVVPHLLALGVFLYWAFTSGAMDYGSIICVGPLALLMVIGLGVGWARIVAAAKPKQETGAQETEASESPVPEPYRASLEARVAAGLCPRCGDHVAPTDQNCPTCRVNLAWAREHLDELAGEETPSLPDSPVH